MVVCLWCLYRSNIIHILLYIHSTISNSINKLNFIFIKLLIIIYLWRRFSS
nr:MAG TPA: hypothetical protein [Bacteriophage sp.]